MLEKNNKISIRTILTSLPLLFFACCFLPVATWAQNHDIPSEIFGEYTGETQITIALLDISQNLEGVTVELQNTGAANDYILMVKGLDIFEYFEIPVEMDYVIITPFEGGYSLSRAEPITIIIPEVTLPPIPILLPNGGTFYNVSTVITLENSRIVADILKLNLKIAISGIIPIIPIVVNIAFEGTISTSSIATIAEIASVKVYPNPTTGQLSITNIPRWRGQGVEQLTINNVEVFDVYGRKQKIIINYQLSIINSINISHLPEGVYLLKIQTEKGIQIRKIIKKE